MNVNLTLCSTDNDNFRPLFCLVTLVFFPQSLSRQNSTNSPTYDENPVFASRLISKPTVTPPCATYTYRHTHAYTHTLITGLQSSLRQSTAYCAKALVLCRETTATYQAAVRPRSTSTVSSGRRLTPILDSWCPGL